MYMDNNNGALNLNDALKNIARIQNGAEIRSNTKDDLWLFVTEEEIIRSLQPRRDWCKITVFLLGLLAILISEVIILSPLIDIDSVRAL